VAFVLGTFVAFALGWGWPGLFNLAVVDLNRHAPGAATGVTQTGIYVGAAAGPAAYGLLSHEIGYSGAWAVSGGLMASASAYRGELMMVSNGDGVIGSLRELSTPYHLAHGLLDYAQHLTRMNDNDPAAAATGEARDIARRLRCQSLLDRAETATPAEPPVPA